MENNTERSFTKEVSPATSVETKEIQALSHESFLVETQRSIDEVGFIKQEQGQEMPLADLESFGESCGLTKEEARMVLEEKGLVGRLAELRNKMVSSCDNFISKVRKVGAVATTALVFGASVPVSSYATEQVLEPVRIEKETLPTYEEAIENLHKSVMTDKLERVLVSVRNKDGILKPIVLREGGKTSIKCPQEVFDALKRGEEVEMTHTHPLETYFTAGLMNPEEIEKARAGEIIPGSMPPSLDADFIGAVALEDSVKNNMGKIHHKVIDPTGEWSYWIPNSASENLNLIKKLKEVSSEIMKVVGERNTSNLLESSEKEYLNAITEVFEDPRMVFSALSMEVGLGSSTAKTIFFKLGIEGIISKHNKSLSKNEQIANGAITEYLSLKISANNTVEYNEQIAKSYEEASHKLGFELKYTPNKI